jgi:hypothetical protein
MSQLQEASPRAGASGVSAGPAPSASFYTHQIANSVRLGNSGYLKRTPSGAGNRQTWTFSTWLKLTELGANSNSTSVGAILNAGTSGHQSGFYRLNFNTTKLFSSSAEANFFFSNSLYRDTAGWYHIVWKQGSGTATVYINGEAASGATASVSGDTAINNNVQHTIGTHANALGETPLKAYLAETIMIDGTALDPSSFGETKNGVWIPKDASGLTYGTNGFRLDYADSSALGNDVSGNNNDWTTVNLSTHDQTTDSPTFGGSTGGNFMTYNPLNKGSYTDLSEGNLKADSNTGADATYPTCTFGVNSGKWYVEHLIKTVSGNFPQTTLADFGGNSYNTSKGIFYAMRYHPANGCEKGSGTNITGFGTITVVNTSVATFSSGDIVSWHIDMDNKKAWIAKNGTIPNSGNPATGANPQFSWTENPINSVTVGSVQYQSTDTILNAGQEGTFAGEVTAGGNADDSGFGNFKYAPTAGYLAMCSGNLPTVSTISPAETDDNFPKKLFGVVLYTGNGSQRTISTPFQFDWLWSRSSVQGQNNYILDTTRGIFGTNNYYVKSDTTDLQADLPQDNYVSQTASGSDAGGYVLSSGTWFNSGSHTQLNWIWRANAGVTSTNTQGSEDSTVQVDPSGHFSIVKWTGTSDSWSNAITLGHGLSSAPTVIIGKKYLGNADEWKVFFSDYGDYTIGGSNTACNSLTWNSDSALYTNQSYKGWGGVMPTSTVFTVDGNNLNGSGDTVLAYCFANCEGYIKSGTYVGNANADGTFVYTGFRPAFVMNKPLATGNWRLQDTVRSPYNVSQNALSPNNNNAQDTDASVAIDILSNGFKMRDSQTPWNQSTTYVYLAFAENPFAFANAR